MPNVSRPNINRPNPGGVQRPAGGLNPGMANRPGGARPNLPGNTPQRPNTSIPNLANKLPQRPGGAVPMPSRPGVPGGVTRPGGANRPDLANRPGGNRPGAGTLPGGIGQGSRPTTRPGGVGPGAGRPDGGLATRPGGRPSAGDLNDFLGIQKPSRPTTLPATRPGGERPVTLPGRPGDIARPGDRPGGNRPGAGERPVTLPGRPGDLARPGNRPGSDRPVTLPGRPGDRPGAGNRPGGGDRPELPDWVNRPGRPGGDWRPGGDNSHIHRPPSWADRPGSININNNWNTIINRGGNNLGNWIARNPSRGLYWGNWGNSIRHNWGHYHHHNDWFGPRWWNGHYHHMGGWHYHYWNNNNRWSYWWTVPVWANLNSWFTWSTPSGYWSQPYYYDYGSGGNVTYQDNSVYIDGQQVGSTADFAASAAELATVQPPANEEEAQDAEWMPLGTFAVSTNEKDSEPSRTVQLAVNKQGIVSGTLYNSQTDTAQTVLGQVDKETQRVAMRIGESDDIVVETGLYNLTQDECPVMVHFGAEKTENWLLVRLEYEGDENEEGGDNE